MLEEYFALRFAPDATGQPALHTLPRLLDGHTPGVNNLPELLLRLGASTRWDEEKSCFADVAAHLGLFYAPLQPPPDATPAVCEQHARFVEHTLLPAMRTQLWPPERFATDGTVLQVACLEQLYKVFERC